MKKMHLVKLSLLITLVVLLLVYTLPWIIVNSQTRDYSGIDFHGYWYAGHYLRAGVNPYAAILNNDPFPIYWDPRIPGSGIPYRLGALGGFERALKLPIHYLDGVVITDYPVARLLIVAPSATAPLEWFVSLFSWFSWNVARTLWLLLSLLFAALIPWLGYRLFPASIKINILDKLLTAFVFYNLYGLRQTLVVGQQSLICLFTLLLALVLRDRWILAGILLGFGISKYSVGLPVFLFFLFQKEYRIILTSLAVQVLAALFFLPLEQGSLIETITAYLKVLDLNYSQTGVHLAAHIPSGNLSVFAATLVLVVLAVFSLRRACLFVQNHPEYRSLFALNSLNLMVVTVFLGAYHRIHDMPFIIFFLLTLVAVHAYGLEFSKAEHHSINLLQVGLLILLVYPAVLMKITSMAGVPAEFAGLVFSEDVMSMISLLVIFGVSIWFQKKLIGKQL